MVRSTIKGGIPATLTFDERGSKTLLVLFSPNQKPALRKYPFLHDCLYIADRSQTYYLRGPGIQSLRVQEFIKSAGYEQAIFIGSSKGGAGALLWSSLIFRRNVKFKIYCIAFSPQTKLYPYNENLASLPSYLRAMRHVDSNASAKVTFEKYGDIAAYISGMTPTSLVVFSQNYRMDAIEAGALTDNRSVQLMPLDLAFHGAIVPFVTDITDATQMSRLAKKLYADAERDPDLKASLPKDREQFSPMFARLRCQSLNELIDKFCDSSDL